MLSSTANRHRSVTDSHPRKAVIAHQEWSKNSHGGCQLGDWIICFSSSPSCKGVVECGKETNTHFFFFQSSALLSPPPHTYLPNIVCFSHTHVFFLKKIQKIYLYVNHAWAVGHLLMYTMKTVRSTRVAAAAPDPIASFNMLVHLVLLYYFIQFGSNASRSPQICQNVTQVTQILVKCRNHLKIR